MKPTIIAFDADDTLWVNEPYYRETEDKFYELLREYMPVKELADELFKTEIDNLELYGYGAKGFALSMIETAIRVTNKKLSAGSIEQIITLGKTLVDMPIHLLNNVELVLKTLQAKYKLIVATKGDLLDQQRKLKKSGLAKYFDHVEIMSDKKEDDYRQLIHRLQIEPSDYMMIGNSFKSDILPVLNIGGFAIHVPYLITWQHEHVDDTSFDDPKYNNVKELIEILDILE
jgi:putative hydrolase of the HAD superfamily